MPAEHVDVLAGKCIYGPNRHPDLPGSVAPVEGLHADILALGRTCRFYTSDRPDEEGMAKLRGTWVIYQISRQKSLHVSDYSTEEHADRVVESLTEVLSRG